EFPIAMLKRLVFLVAMNIPLVGAFDWGDFHKVAVIFFSFFGPGVILGAIGLAAYFACIRSWYESFREEVRETHRSFHPWPPGSAKWQLQQYARSSGSPSVKQLKSTPPPVIQKSALRSPIPPGYLISPARYTDSKPPPVQVSQVPPQPPSSFVQDTMNNPREKAAASHPLEIYCGPSSTYVPYTVSSPNDRPMSTQFSPNYTMVESSHENAVMKVPPQPSFNEAGQQLEAITVRTTTTTRRTTVLSPTLNRPYTIV
ncbi:hypothetical protein GCK32_010555, partial [Trichostrongylus colubriformis]